MDFAVIGAGAMGRWFAGFGKERGWNVTLSDIDPERAEEVAGELGVDVAGSNEEAAEGAELVLVSVPIKETPGVVEDVSDSLEEGALLFDITSVKEGVVEKMEELDLDSELASIHPLFGPGAGKLEGKNMIAVPVRAGDRYRELIGTFSDLGANLVEMGAGDHDRLMAVTQSLTHFTLLSYFSALDSMDRIDEAEELQTPMFQNLLGLTKAFLMEEPGLCGDIQTENRYAADVRSSLKEACRSLDEALGSGDIGPIEEVFESARGEIGEDEIERAYDSIYERSEGGSE